MIEKININGVEYHVTPVAEGELPTGVTVKVDGVVYQLGDPVVATAAEPAATSTEGTIEKISVNGAVYDIADVEAVAAERKRAMEAETAIGNILSEELGQEIDARMSADNDTRGKGVLFGGFSNRQTTADEVVIGYKNIAQNAEGAFAIPAATTEKAGVMSAEDKEKLDSIEIINNLTTGGADKALSAEMGKELEKNIYPFIIGSDKVNRCILELYIYPERHEGHELKLTTCYKPNKAITFVIDNDLNNQVRGYNIERVGDVDLFELRGLIDKAIYGYCLIDWSRLPFNGLQGDGVGIANINYTSYFHINTAIYKYLNSAEIGNINVQVNAQAGVLQDIYAKIDSGKANIEAGSINYLNGTNISDPKAFRSAYITVSNGNYKIQVKSPLNINRVYVVKYNNNKYVGYSLESFNFTIVVDESFNQIRVRVDCSSEVTDSDVENSTITVVCEDGIYNYINEQKYISYLGNPLFESSVDFTYPGFINLSTGQYVSMAVEFGTSDYIGVFPGQTVSVTFAGYGNCGIAGYSDNQGGGFIPVVKLSANASQKPRTETFIIPDNVYYIRISSITTAVPVGKIEYITLCNVSILAEILSKTFSGGSGVKEIFKGLTELSLYKLSCSGVTNDYQGFRLNFNIPEDDDKIILSTDIHNTNFRDNPTVNELIKAFAPVLFYKMQKVGCFVLYDIEKQNRPFIYDVDGNKKYLTLTDE